MEFETNVKSWDNIENTIIIEDVWKIGYDATNYKYVIAKRVLHLRTFLFLVSE